MNRNLKTVFFYGITIITVLVCIVLSNHTVTTLAESAPDVREHCIIIDPGHGGEDGGAVSLSGTPESIYNLDISRKLNHILNLLGYRTKLIRDSDISIYTRGETLAQKKISDLKERVRQVNETDGGILLSIHQNFYADSRYSGPQVFYANTENSEELAREIQTAFLSVLKPENKRKEKKSSGIYLMEHIRCPGVLIECGFLSNTHEEILLKDPAYQKKLSCVIAASVSRYLSNT